MMHVAAMIRVAKGSEDMWDRVWEDRSDMFERGIVLWCFLVDGGNQDPVGKKDRRENLDGMQRVRSCSGRAISHHIKSHGSGNPANAPTLQPEASSCGSLPESIHCPC